MKQLGLADWLSFWDHFEGCKATLRTKEQTWGDNIWSDSSNIQLLSAYTFEL